MADEMTGAVSVLVLASDLERLQEEVKWLRASQAELLVACKLSQLAFRATSKAEKDYTGECQALRSAIKNAEKGPPCQPTL